MSLLATIVEWDAVLKSVVASLVAGLGVTLAFSFAIYGAVRTAELRRDERPLAAGLAGAVMFAGLAISVGAVTLGVLAMTSK